MTYHEWFEQIRVLEHRSPQAQALIRRYPGYYQQLGRTVRAALDQLRDRRHDTA